MKLTVLGKYGPYPPKDGGTTSYLIEVCGKRILIDAGSGSLSRVQKFCALEEIDMIVLTHLHFDHCSEMFILRYALRGEKAIPVYMPRTPVKEYGILHACHCFDVTELSEELEVCVPETNIKLHFCRTIHPVECYAVKISDGEKTFIFSGDSEYSDHLAEFCKQVDVFLCDSGFLTAQEEKREGLPHMYVKEAALTAHRAKVDRLFLTHINPVYREEDILKEALEVFKNVQIVEELKQYHI